MVAVYADPKSSVVAASDDLVVSVATDKVLVAEVVAATVNDIVAIISSPVFTSVCFFVLEVALYFGACAGVFIVEAISVDPEIRCIGAVVRSILGPVRPGFDPVVTSATNEKILLCFTSVTTVYFVLAFSSV